MDRLAGLTGVGSSRASPVPATRARGSWRSLVVMKPARIAAARRRIPGSPFDVPVVEELAETYELHDLVTHDKYGLGSILAVEGEAAVVVDFGAQRLRVALPCGKLSKL
jgi:hypothetical protein